MADLEVLEPRAVEAEIVPFNSPKAVMVTPRQLRLQMKRDEEMRAVINEYIKNNMVAGKDYGSIQVKGATSKPSLFKPGAEKFCGLFKIRPSFRKDTDTVEMFGNKAGIVAYICELVDSRGQVVGEGRGAYSVSPDATDFDINKAVKIAEKRAQIDAVLRTGALSDFFTQDMEDAPKANNAPVEHKETRPATGKQIDMLMSTAKRITGYDNGNDLENWLNKAIGAPLNKLSTKSASQAIGKLLDLEKRMDSEDRAKDTALDEVVTDIPEGPINLDDVPY